MPSSAGRDERRRRRALLKAHHPDLGGDPTEFIRAVAATQPGRSPAPAPVPPADEVRFVRRARGLARVRELLRAARRPRRGTGTRRVV